MADKTAAFKMYSEDPEVVAALREELIPNAEFSDSTRREYIDGFYEEMTEAAPVPHSIPRTCIIWSQQSTSLYDILMTAFFLYTHLSAG